MKSYVLYLQGLYDSILVDLSIEYPQLRHELRRDSSRLRSLIENRGLTFPLVDCNAFGKHLEQALTEGRLGPSNIPGFGCGRGGRIPRLFKGIFLLVFDKTGVLRGDCPPRAILHLRMLLYVAKRLKVSCPKEKVRETIHEFFTVDAGVRLGSLAWSDDEKRFEPRNFDESRKSRGTRSSNQGDLLDLLEIPESLIERSGYLAYLDQVCEILSSSLGSFDPARWPFRHGPGAVSDQSKSVDKYTFPIWPEQLDKVFPWSEFGLPNYRAWVDSLQAGRVPRTVEHYSKLIAVPKTYSKPRLIASEPTAMQWAQQSIRAFLASRVKFSWIGAFIDFGRQDLSQELALTASRDGKLATIDLSSASDRISTWLVERVFRDESLLDALRACRTRFVSTDEPGFQRVERLRKFSCMGSACTFPVQTLIFLAISLAAILYVDKEKPSIGNMLRYRDQVRIFGDDIIVPVRCVAVLKTALHHLGLKVNLQKSFSKGNFREACGMDAYKGVRVNPVYVLDRADKSRPESVVSAVASHNNLFDRGYFATASYIESTIHNEVSKLRYVEADSGAFGLKSLDPKNNLRKRVNRRLQVLELYALRVKTKRTVSRTEGDAALLQYWTEAPPPDLNWSAEKVPQTRIVLDYGWVKVG